MPRSLVTSQEPHTLVPLLSDNCVWTTTLSYIGYQRFCVVHIVMVLEATQSKRKMWSAGFSGRHGLFNAQQRIIFPVKEHSDGTKRSIARILPMGVTTALDIASPDDLKTLHMVRDALQNATTQNPLLHRSQFIVIAKTAKDWSLDSLCDHVKRVVRHLQLDKLDVLLLSRDSMPPRQNIYERKRVVSAYWECMVQVQRLGLAREIGVSDLLMDEMELISIAFPANPPAVLAISIEIATDKSHEAQTTLRPFLSFAHGRSMDVLVRFPIRGLDRPSEAWEEVRFRIAQRVRATVFDASIVNEAEAEPYRTERRDMTESETLQTSLQIIVRYFIQQGVVVIPVLDGEDDNQFTEDEAHQLFTVLPHPFTGLEPSYSPQTQYSSILTRDELVEIDRVLPLAIMESQTNRTE